MKNQRIASIMGYLTTVLGLATIISLQTLHLNQVKSQKVQDYAREEHSLKVMLNLQKKMPSFGFDNLIADWNFLKYIQYYGDKEARQQTGYTLISDFFEGIVASDPHFVSAFLNLSAANSIYAGRPDKTVAFMEEVLKFVSPKTSSRAHYILIYKGVDEMLFLGDLKAAQNSYEKAAEWATIAGENIVADYARNTAQFLSTNPDSKEVQISAWSTVLSIVPDKETQQYAINKIQELGAKVIVTSAGRLEIKMPKSS